MLLFPTLRPFLRNARTLLHGVLLVLCTLPAPAADDAAAITQVLKSQFDRPGQPLTVRPVNSEGPFAIAGWSQGTTGGRALLQRSGAQWQVVLCAGDALLQPVTLTGAGMATDAATRLLARVRASESTLPAATRTQFARFGGVVPMGHGAHADHAAHAAAEPPAELLVRQAWARATTAGMTLSAAFFTVENRGARADVLLGVSSPVARSAELHRSFVENGMARMRPAGEVQIAAGATVVAEPGGLHVMLMGLKAPLAAGSQIPLQLTFRSAGTITVQARVQPLGAMAPRAATAAPAPALAHALHTAH